MDTSDESRQAIHVHKFLSNAILDSLVVTVDEQGDRGWGKMRWGGGGGAGVRDGVGFAALLYSILNSSWRTVRLVPFHIYIFFMSNGLSVWLRFNRPDITTLVD